MTNIEGPGKDDSATWVPASCTLPTVERPLRVAEFDDLFATSVRAIDRPGATRLVLMLDTAAEAAARDLAAQEIGCCSFFEFDFAPAVSGELRMTVSVPAGQVRVLDALTERAAAASGSSMP